MNEIERLGGKKLTQLQVLYRQAWRRGWREGEFAMNFSTVSDAHKFRIGMYAERKRMQPGEIDQELMDAVLNCEIPNPSSVGILTIRHRMGGRMSQFALQALGGIEKLENEEFGFLEKVIPPTQAAESLKKLAGLLEEENAAQIEAHLPAELISANSYFQRGEF